MGVLLLFSKVLIALLAPASLVLVVMNLPRRRMKTVAVGVGLLLLACMLVIPNHIQYQSDRRKAACAANLRTIAGALQYFSRAGSGKYPPSLAMLVPNYLAKMPACPSAGDDTYSPSYTVDDEQTAFTAFCQGLHHSSLVASPADYPRCSSIDGLRETP